MRTYRVPPRLAAVKDWPRLAFDSRYRVSAVAKRCGVKARQFRTFCKRTLKRTAKRWLRELRLSRAEVLLDGGNPSGFVAGFLGYTNTPHFCNEFKRMHGLSPRAWRKKKCDRAPHFTEVHLPTLPPPKQFPDESEFPWLLPPGWLMVEG